MRKACAQPVYGLGTVSDTAVGLWTGTVAHPQSPVYVSPTYTSSIPIFVLALMHRFFDHLVSVTDQLVHLFHTTNKDQYKYKLRNNS